ncbi:hypothetical protein PAPHU_61 [Mycobacterium phage Paphu]|uniref:hypothetical protein n=1 Tax=Mycobacterium phage Lamina13 TaxID=1468169 RepID=UPI00043B0960|nr:hypothetical protein FH32_gp65 [Mycobacterium phage Lamina13]YP_009197643.1 hypothetical protein AVV04_gp30 [Mycobacterium phage Tasp14]AHN84479.1 hypothetical protein PBI_LAMINA13_65 [Mycobacterium phage Lamina13]ALA11955.1 hypothetical protein SEA_TASP14_65 [Mycobacterium phage Tasp14]QFG12997.1 hypothetical protein PAPHU_61 [Mycobacterium phage Paphu]
MSSEAQNVIAGVVQKHQWHGGILGCGRGCDWRPSFDRTWACGEEDRLSREHAAHVAEEIDKALGGLTRRWGVVIEHPPRPADGYPGAVVELDSYKLREATEITKRDQWPDDCYEVRSRWVSGWSEA